MAEKNPVGMRLAREEFMRSTSDPLQRRAFEAAGRDIRRAEFSEAAEKRQYRKAADMAKAAGIDPKKSPKAFRKYVRKALRALDRPVGPEYIEVPIRNKAGDIIRMEIRVVDRPLSDIEFAQLYSRNPPRRDQVQPTLGDSDVKKLIAAGKTPDEARKIVGDIRWRISRDRWDEMRQRIRQDPVLIEITDPNDPLFVKRAEPPKRSDFALTDEGRVSFEEALAKWAAGEKAEGRQTKFYVCRLCTHSVRTGHACKCTLDSKLKLPRARPFPAFKAPKKRPTESEKSYEIRYDTALVKYKLRKGIHEERERESLFRQLMKLPAERRLYQSIAKTVRERMGPRPKDPADQIDYDAKVAKLAGEELVREIGARAEATQAEAVPSPAARAPFVGTMRGPGLLRSLEKVAAPGTVTVRAGSKEEAESKATYLATKAEVAGPEQAARAAAEIVARKEGGPSRTEKRIAFLEARKAKKGLSRAEEMELKRLLSSEILEVRRETIIEKKQLSGFADDPGGSIVGLAVGGLVAFALFKALTEKGVKS